MRGTASKAAADAHLRYLERDGVTRDGEKGRAYSTFENDADGREFIERRREDRHQFRFIVALRMPPRRTTCAASPATWRSHYVETADAQKVEAIGRGHIVALEPIRLTDKPRAADLNIRDMTDEAGIYRPDTHLQAARAKIERIGGDPEAFVRSHVRRLEALRRAGHVERIDADRWKIPADIAERGMAHDARNRGRDFCRPHPVHTRPRPPDRQRRRDLARPGTGLAQPYHACQYRVRPGGR